MKKFTMVILVLGIGFTLYANGRKEKVLLYIRSGESLFSEYLVEHEFDVMAGMIGQAGFKVVVVTDTGKPVKVLSGESTLIEPDKKLTEIEVDDYVGIIMPCMSQGHVSHVDPVLILIIEEAVKQGKPIAAQHAAIEILADAGVLKGKKCTYFLPSTVGAIYSGDGVVQDGLIITGSHDPNAARKYDGEDTTSELTELFIKAIKN